MTRDYEAQANEFCQRFGFTIKAAWQSRECPKWEHDNRHIHGDKYRITIKGNNPKRSISFNFWNSFNDKHEGKTPSNYDILACVSSDCFLPTDPDEIISELGNMPFGQAKAAAKHAAKLQAFFSDDEQIALRDIS